MAVNWLKLYQILFCHDKTMGLLWRKPCSKDEGIHQAYPRPVQSNHFIEKNSAKARFKDYIISACVVTNKSHKDPIYNGLTSNIMVLDSKWIQFGIVTPTYCICVWTKACYYTATDFMFNSGSINKPHFTSKNKNLQ